MIHALMIVILLIVLSPSIMGQAQTPAPRLTLKAINGRALSLSNYKGKVVLLNFWATWCAPCRAEMPDLVRLQRENRKRGLQVIGVTYPPQDLREARRFLRSIKVNYPVAIGDELTKSQFDPGETLPLTVVIDRTGTIREIIQGILFSDEFEEKVKPLLR
jgi:thiol-disulfide isomerase/thioredoxin